MMQAMNTICLWYDGDGEEAAGFYSETFRDSSVDAVHKALGKNLAIPFLHSSVLRARGVRSNVMIQV